jgi:hypothetical protein
MIIVTFTKISALVFVIFVSEFESWDKRTDTTYEEVAKRKALNINLAP